MARLLKAEIPDNKNIFIGLTYIFGIGRPRSKEILFNAKIDPMKKIGSLTDKEHELINKELKKYIIDSELRKEVQSRISEHIRLGTYKGTRLSRKPNPLPIRGQRTRHNARTAKGGGIAKKKSTIANKRKAPSAK